MASTMLLLIALLVAGCSNNQHAGTEEKSSREQAREKAVATLVQQFDAIRLDDRLEKIRFTFELQELLKSKTVAFVATLDDIVAMDEGYNVRFVIFNVPRSIAFELGATVEQGSALAAQVENALLLGIGVYEFAVVAKIDSVHRAAFAVRAFPTNEDEAELELDVPHTYIATGRLLNFSDISTRQR